MSKISKARFLARLEAGFATAVKVALYVGMAAVVAMMLLTVVHAVGRYAFDKPVNPIIELSSFLLVTAVFLIASYGMLTKSEITIGLLADRYPPRGQAIADAICFLLCLVFTTGACWQTSVRGAFLIHARQASAILHIPNFPFYYIVAFGWFLFSLATLIQLIHAVGRAEKK